MRKLDLRSYDWTEKVIGGEGKPIETTVPYHVKDSIINIMFLPALQLMGAALIKQNVLATKIEICKDDFIELENEEYERVKEAAEKFISNSRAHVQLIDRILNQTPEIK